jgi:polar amino acid transport system ATP-binding protein
MSVVSLRSVRKVFGALEVLRGVDLEVDRGRVVALIGRSGSGKSTLLRCVNGLETISGGEITVAGQRVSRDPAALRALRQTVGIVFQGYNLFPHLTAERNVTIGLTVVKGLPADKAKRIASDVLAKVGMLDKRDAYPDQLSGGQQQRVAIARSLAMSPSVMLFDEVTSALDPELKAEVLKVMEQLAKDGMTMMLVTHELSFARSVATDVVFIHQGRIWESGPPDVMFGAPKTPELKLFMSSLM